MSLLSAVIQEADKASAADYKKQRDEILDKVKDLVERTQMLSSALIQHIVDSYWNFCVTKSLERFNYSIRKAKIFSEEEEIKKSVDALRSINSNDEELENFYNKFCGDFEYLKDLCIVADGKRILEKADHDFRRFNYSNALLDVKALQKRLKVIRFEGDVAKALVNMRDQAENQIALYSAHLSVEWEEIFSWSERKGVDFLTYSMSVQQSDLILIEKVLKSLYVADRLNGELGEFSLFFVNKLLHNVIRYNCDIYTEDHIGAIVFNIKLHLNDVYGPSYQTIFNNLSAIFEFLQSTLGTPLKEFISVFSGSIKDKFFNKMIDDCIRHHVPTCQSDYEDYQSFVVELDMFNKTLIEINFVKAEESPFNQFIDDTEKVLFDKKCSKLLTDVRFLLGESLTFGTVEVGSSTTNDNESLLDITNHDLSWDKSKPMFLPKCVISRNVEQVLTMITDHLVEGGKLPEKYYKPLVEYVKDIAVMYQGIVPKKFKVNLESCPLDIALFFNNCFYLAHGLMGPPWKSILPDALANRLTFALLECIQDLRMEGMEKISLYLQKQRDLIVQKIEANYESAWSDESVADYACALNAAARAGRELRASWARVLPARAYRRCAGALARAAAGAALRRLLAAAPPAPAAPAPERLVRDLADRLAELVGELRDLFEEPIDFEKEIDCWSKLIKMPLLLKAQLLELSRLWNEDRELSQVYTCEEVRQIIKMRFPDDEYRLRILMEIQ